jgi:hypothetical protein
VTYKQVNSKFFLRSLQPRIQLLPHAICQLNKPSGRVAEMLVFSVDDFQLALDRKSGNPGRNECLC